jgi:hypothetical protein
MTLVALYAMAVGLLMIAQWTFTLVKQQAPEFKTEPVRIGLHITAEFATALVLILSGIGLLTQSAWGTTLYMLGAGMLIYTLIQSPGYYAQKRVWLPVAMFAVLMILTLFSLPVVWNA